jgi:hypothetical protein
MKHTKIADHYILAILDNHVQELEYYYGDIVDEHEEFGFDTGSVDTPLGKTDRRKLLAQINKKIDRLRDRLEAA